MIRKLCSFDGVTILLFVAGMISVATRQPELAMLFFAYPAGQGAQVALARLRG